MTTPCPSVAELLERVRSLTRPNDGTFETAWRDSFIDPHHCCEQGGFIYVDFPVPATLTRVFVTRAPRGQTMNQRTAGPNASIDLNNPGIAQDNVILVANFHTHPLSPRVEGDPLPSRRDMSNAYFRGVPGIVVSRPGIYSYGPERREDLSNPKGYARPEDEPVMPRSVLAKNAPPPPTQGVPNQWPELENPRSRDVESDDHVTTDDVEVLIIEWSDEGVVYGETLNDTED